MNKNRLTSSVGLNGSSARIRAVAASGAKESYDIFSKCSEHKNTRMAYIKPRRGEREWSPLGTSVSS